MCLCIERQEWESVAVPIILFCLKFGYVCMYIHITHARSRWCLWLYTYISTLAIHVSVDFTERTSFNIAVMLDMPPRTGLPRVGKRKLRQAGPCRRCRHLTLAPPTWGFAWVCMETGQQETPKRKYSSCLICDCILREYQDAYGLRRGATGSSKSGVQRLRLMYNIRMACLELLGSQVKSSGLRNTHTYEGATRTWSCYDHCLDHRAAVTFKWIALLTYSYDGRFACSSHSPVANCNHTVVYVCMPRYACHLVAWLRHGTSQALRIRVDKYRNSRVAMGSVT